MHACVFYFCKTLSAVDITSKFRKALNKKQLDLCGSDAFLDLNVHVSFSAEVLVLEQT